MRGGAFCGFSTENEMEDRELYKDVVCDIVPVGCIIFYAPNLGSHTRAIQKNNAV